MVNEISLVSLGNTNVQFIDGDRGKNYPQKTDFYKDGYCVFLNTGNVKPDGFDFSDLYYITQEKDEILNKGRVQLNDIVLTTRGTVGNVAIFDDQVPFKKIRINSGMVIIRCSNRFYPYFLYSFFRSSLFKSQCGLNGSGSAQPQLPISAIKNIKIPEFNLKTQQSIAAVLSALDKKIALNKQINARLEQMAKTLYDYWFVQFDFPDANGKPYKSSGGEMVFDEILKREIPKGWEVKKIENILTIGSGFPFNSKDYTDRGKYQIVTIKNVQDTYLDLTKTDRIDKIPNNMKEFCILKKGDVLISLTGNIGRICFVDRDNLLLNQRVGKMICSNKYLHFFYLLFNRNESKERLEKLANGSSQSNLSPIEAVKDLFICPSNIVLEKFNAKVDLLFKKLLLNQQQNYHLTQLRDFLLPMLMNGQVSVAD